MTPWVETNLEILSGSYPELEAVTDGDVEWVCIPARPVPEGTWTADSVDVAFRIPNNAGEAPYAFWVRPGLGLKSGATIGNYSFPSPTPWGTDWGQFSFSPHGLLQPYA